jgi:hypothetical protein
MMSGIRGVRIKVKGWIRIRIKVMRIRHPALGNDPDSVALKMWSQADAEGLMEP